VTPTLGFPLGNHGRIIFSNRVPLSLPFSLLRSGCSFQSILKIRVLVLPLWPSVHLFLIPACPSFPLRLVLFAGSWVWRFQWYFSGRLRNSRATSFQRFSLVGSGMSFFSACPRSRFTSDSRLLYPNGPFFVRPSPRIRVCESRSGVFSWYSFVSNISGLMVSSARAFIQTQGPEEVFFFSSFPFCSQVFFFVACTSLWRLMFFKCFFGLFRKTEAGTPFFFQVSLKKVLAVLVGPLSRRNVLMVRVLSLLFSFFFDSPFLIENSTRDHIFAKREGFLPPASTPWKKPRIPLFFMRSPLKAILPPSPPPLTH